MSLKDHNEVDGMPPSRFPSAEILSMLAISNSGFVFDPVSGASYTVNASGLAILDLLRGGCAGVEEAVGKLGEAFDAPAGVLERDVIEFAARLRALFR